MTFSLPRLARHWQSRESRFLALLALSLLAIGFYLDRSLQLAAHDGAGHRAIDLKTLQRRIESGELNDREALWYRPVSPDRSSTVTDR